MWFQGNSAIFAVAAVGDVRRLTSSATMAGAAVHLEDSRRAKAVKRPLSAYARTEHEPQEDQTDREYARQREVREAVRGSIRRCRASDWGGRDGGGGWNCEDQGRLADGPIGKVVAVSGSRAGRRAMVE